jgi:hypothetical protein
MSQKGHEDQFRPPSLNDRYQLGEATFAGMDGKEEDAGTAAIQHGRQEPVFMPSRR